MKVKVTLLILCLVTVVVTQSFAAIDSTQGAVVESAPPVSVVDGKTESNSIILIFAEKQSFTLPTDISINISTPGNYSFDAFRPTPGILSAGTVINIYFIHFDPVGRTFVDLNGTVTFSEDILGVIEFDSSLDISDSTLGAVGTTYPTRRRNRGLESGSRGARHLTVFR